MEPGEFGQVQLISVIVPVFQVGPYLTEALESVALQSYRRMEVILVDDGSTDDGPRICDEFAVRDPRFRVIHQANRGLSGARNAGLDVARGDFITFFDGDDVLASNCLERMLALAAKENADIVALSIVPYHGLETSYRESTGFAILSGEQAVQAMVVDRPRWEAQGKLYSSTIFGSHRFREGVLFEDLELIPSVLSQAQRVILSDDALYGYRTRSGSIMAENRKSLSPDLVKVLQLNIDRIPEHQRSASPTFAAYVLHAAKQIERFTWEKRRLSRPFLGAYRKFIAANMAPLRRNPYVGRAYLLGLRISRWTPEVFIVGAAFARPLKASIAPFLRRGKQRVAPPSNSGSGVLP